MKHILLTGHIFFLTLLSSPSFAVLQGFHSLPSRDDAEQPLWLIEPDKATHSVILFAGGKGKLNIDESGIGKEGNFLVRTREQFTNQGMVVAVVDKPTDKEKLFRFRKTNKHAQDIKAVIALLRERHPDKPVWLVGTSRGTISAANAAARLKGQEGPDGIVLTSSVTLKSKKNLDSLDDIDLSAITVPTFVIHHENDDCIVTPYENAEALLEELSSVQVKEFKGFSGGDSVGNPCKGKSYHGFLGIEEKVVTAIVNWIKTH